MVELRLNKFQARHSGVLELFKLHWQIYWVFFLNVFGVNRDISV